MHEMITLAELPDRNGGTVVVNAGRVLAVSGELSFSHIILATGSGTMDVTVAGSPKDVRIALEAAMQDARVKAMAGVAMAALTIAKTATDALADGTGSAE